MNELDIELVEEHDKVNIYTLRFKNEENTEFEKFILKFPEGCEHEEDIDVVISWVDRIGNNGALERYFRNEGKYGEGLIAIPIEQNGLRLYCMRLSDNIIIIGNGGIKNVRRWQDDPDLSLYMETLSKIGKLLKSRLKKSSIKIINNKELTGNLKFKI